MPTLAVTVNRVAYPPPTADTDWYILITSHGACKGKMAWRPQDGESLILDGEWATYKGDREFAFKSARLDVPTNPRDQLRYVCARTTGLGPAMEELIWAAAGANWQAIEPGAVPRLNGKLYAAFLMQCEALELKSAEARVVSALMGKGATMNLACAAWAQWGEETLGVVHADPYRLAELENYSFRDVDGKIRRGYKIGDDDERRIKAAVVYALRRLLSGGDTIAAWDDLYREACGLLAGYADQVTECTRALFDDGVLKGFKKSRGVALAADWRAERDIWKWINAG